MLTSQVDGPFINKWSIAQPHSENLLFAFIEVYIFNIFVTRTPGKKYKILIRLIFADTFFVKSSTTYHRSIS